VCPTTMSARFFPRRAGLAVTRLDDQSVGRPIVELELRVGQVRMMRRWWCGEMSRLARMSVWRSMERPPRKAQNGLGRSHPKQARMKGCSLRPSPPANTMPQRCSCMLGHTAASALA